MYKNWIIVNYGNFPSSNYCLFNVEKARKWDEKGELPAHGIIYCSSLKNALVSQFQQMIVENCKDKCYEATLTGFSDAIKRTKQEFNVLITPEILRDLKHVKN